MIAEWSSVKRDCGRDLIGLDESGEPVIVIHVTHFGSENAPCTVSRHSVMALSEHDGWSKRCGLLKGKGCFYQECSSLDGKSYPADGDEEQQTRYLMEIAGAHCRV